MLVLFPTAKVSISSLVVAQIIFSKRWCKWVFVSLKSILLSSNLCSKFPCLLSERIWCNFWLFAGKKMCLFVGRKKKAVSFFQRIHDPQGWHFVKHLRSLRLRQTQISQGNAMRCGSAGVSPLFDCVCKVRKKKKTFQVKPSRPSISASRIKTVNEKGEDW